MASNSTHVFNFSTFGYKMGLEKKIKLGVNESTDGSRGWKNVISNGDSGAVAILHLLYKIGP